MMTSTPDSDLVKREYPLIAKMVPGWCDRDVFVNGEPRHDVFNLVYEESADGSVSGAITVPIFAADEFCSGFFELSITTSDPEFDVARKREPIVDRFVECAVYARRTDPQAPGSSPAKIEIRDQGNTVNVSKVDRFMLDVATRTLLFRGRSAWRPGR